MEGGGEGTILPCSSSSLHPVEVFFCKHPSTLEMISLQGSEGAGGTEKDVRKLCVPHRVVRYKPVSKFFGPFKFPTIFTLPRHTIQAQLVKYKLNELFTHWHMKAFLLGQCFHSSCTKCEFLSLELLTVCLCLPPTLCSFLQNHKKGSKKEDVRNSPAVSSSTGLSFSASVHQHISFIKKIQMLWQRNYKRIEKNWWTQEWKEIRKDNGVF